ncbi:MAG: hypothetical protein Q7S82_00260 [bacterium]|nr:hypothetical protein [bacterium]
MFGEEDLILFFTFASCRSSVNKFSIKFNVFKLKHLKKIFLEKISLPNLQ